MAAAERASCVGVKLGCMIDKLVEQIEARVVDLEGQMSDPAVISDRKRYEEVGREYQRLQPAHKLRASTGHWATTSRARGSCSPRTETTPSSASSLPTPPGGSRSSPRRSAWRW